jgi:Protein of unknown function (DUF3016)
MPLFNGCAAPMPPAAAQASRRVQDGGLFDHAQENTMPASTSMTVLAATLAACAALHGAAHAAGKAEVSWVEPQNFRDAGFGSWERERTLKALGEYIERLGRRLPDGQVLKLEVTDLDLAGEVWPRATREVRVLRGGADWPHLSMRYSLTGEGGKVLKAGQADLADMAYQFGGRFASNSEGDFAYEKRMLERWFSEQIIRPNP